VTAPAAGNGGRELFLAAFRWMRCTTAFAETASPMPT
jgi:hypothetical protein